MPTQTREKEQKEQRMPTAHSLEDAANSDNSLEGYVAVNHSPRTGGIDDHDEIAKLAYQYYQERGREHGSHEEDWYRAEQELRRRSQETGDGGPGQEGDSAGRLR